VGYLFEQKGLLLAKGDEDEVMLGALEAGAEDVREAGEGTFEVITNPSDLQPVRRALVGAGIEVESADVTQLPSTTIPVDESKARQLLRLVEALDDLDDVQTVYANFDIEDDVLEKVLAEA
jgi:transcriptional/translational regulatory protein YebC/TACO1